MRAGGTQLPTARPEEARLSIAGSVVVRWSRRRQDMCLWGHKSQDHLFAFLGTEQVGCQQH